MVFFTRLGAYSATEIPARAGSGKASAWPLPVLPIRVACARLLEKERRDRNVIDLPTSEIFAAALAEPRIYAAMAVAALAGVTRGFSGFGGAMIYMPLISAI